MAEAVSFDSIPLPPAVVAAQQRWERLLRQDPQAFEAQSRQGLAELHQRIAALLGARAEQISLAPRARAGVAMLAAQIPLTRKHEVLSSDEEHWALQEFWTRSGRARGFRYRQAPVADLSSFSARTRLLFFSHITSETCRLLPVGELCREARRRGVWSCVDGAHSLGQIEVDLEELAPDFYVSCLHKWLYAPYGAAVCYCRSGPGLAWEPSPEERIPFLCALEALDFWKALDRERGPKLASQARQRLEELTGLPGLPDWGGSMISVRLPDSLPRQGLQRKLTDRGLNVLLARVHGRLWLRARFAWCHYQQEVERLVAGLTESLPVPIDLASLLICPRCQADFAQSSSPWLECANGHRFSVRDGVPRLAQPNPSMRAFTEMRENLSMKLPSQGELDEEKITREEFQAQTSRDPADLKDQWVLDVGCGGGRFLRLLDSYGARVVGLDLDPAGLRECRSQFLNCLQADLFEPPFRPETFDFIYSLGVLHHPPDPPGAFQQWAKLLKPGGEIAVWVYPRTPASPISDWLRPFTTRLPPKVLYGLAVLVTGSYGPLLRLPRIGRWLQARLYRIRLPWHRNRYWRIASFLDWYGPAHQFKYTPEEVEDWFRAAGLKVTRCTDPSSARGQRS